MKKQLLISAMVMAFASTGAFAHHPAADVVDPEIYEMIEENVSDVHADMTFDDMGRDVDEAGDAMESREDVDAAMESRDEMGTENEAREETGEISADLRGPFEQTRIPDDPADEVDTIDLLENVMTTLPE
ncbi:MAG: hypothetical protein ACN4GM_06225 [Gammaproteobacteria bacterium]